MDKRKSPNIPRSTKTMPKHELQALLAKKRECNKKAQEVVEAMLEPRIDTGWLQKELQHINQCHFEDVVTERSIIALCGYPLCSNKLELTPKKTFHIDYARKEVHETSIKCRFCCKNCWKASDYLKEQLLTSPLWYRENETIPVFSFMGLSQVAEPESVTKMEVDEVECKKRKKNPPIISNCQNININTVKRDIRSPVERVEQCVDEWFTASTLLYLFGEDYVKQHFKDKKKELQCVLDESPPVVDCPVIQECSRLFSLLDMEEKPVLKPLPEYNTLKQDTENLKIKYQSFMKGQYVVQGNDNVSSLETNHSLVDANAQRALRRRVLLDQQSKVIKNISDTIGIETINVSEINELVKYFKLSADNITFNPSESVLLALVIIKLISCKNDILKMEFTKHSVMDKTTLLLLNYNLPANYLENIVEWLCDANSIVRKLGKKITT